MNIVRAILRKSREPLVAGKLLIFLLLAGLALLFIEVRFEHQAVLGRRWQAWLPLGYCAFLFLMGPVSLALWNRGGRRLLLICFSVAPLIGTLGFWFHSKGDPWRSVCTVMSGLHAARTNSSWCRWPASISASCTSGARFDGCGYLQCQFRKRC